MKIKFLFVDLFFWFIFYVKDFVVYNGMSVVMNDFIWYVERCSLNKFVKVYFFELCFKMLCNFLMLICILKLVDFFKIFMEGMFIVFGMER